MELLSPRAGNRIDDLLERSKQRQRSGWPASGLEYSVPDRTRQTDDTLAPTFCRQSRGSRTATPFQGRSPVSRTGFRPRATSGRCPRLSRPIRILPLPTIISRLHSRAARVRSSCLDPSLAQAIEYPSGNVPLPIAANAGSTITSTITIGSDPTEAYELITNLVVKLQITYSKDHESGNHADFTGRCTDHAGCTSTPSNGANFGSTNAMFGPTVFADDAANPINSVFSTAPFVGLYAPVTPLADLNGTQLAGTWTLQIQNIGGTSTGTLNSWSITASTRTAPTDLNNGLSQMVVQFDRNIDPSTISAAILSA